MTNNNNHNIKLLIQIILYLLLAMAFFSDYVIEKYSIHLLIFETFIFGILALILLYVGYFLKKDTLKEIGFLFSGSFILIFGWFLWSSLKKELIAREFIWWKRLLDSKVIWLSLFIPLITYLIIEVIIFVYKNKFDYKKVKNK